LAAPSPQQPHQALQGTLFAEEPLASAAAPSRPRRRRTAAPPTPVEEPGDAADANSADAESDLPPWHHHSLVDRQQLTPMLRHYVALKAAHPQRVLLYRLGDFFECFFEDAIQLSQLLELTLTGKEGGKGIGRVPMAGIPHHAAERYCAALVGRGLSVALCDQVEEAAARSSAKGALLKREITRVLTPGTVLEEGLLSSRRNNWLCAVVAEPSRWGLAVADVSTGEFRVTEREGSDLLHQELLLLEAAEGASARWPRQPRPGTHPQLVPPGAAAHAVAPHAVCGGGGQGLPAATV